MIICLIRKPGNTVANFYDASRLMHISMFGNYRAHEPMKIPTSENALLIRTDFSDERAWQKLKADDMAYNHLQDVNVRPS
jgi:hypothetical protein